MKAFFAIFATASLGASSLVGAEGPRGLALFSGTAARMEGWRLLVEGRSFDQAQWRNLDPRWARLWAIGLQWESTGGERIKALMSDPEAGNQSIHWVLQGPSGRVESFGERLPDILQIEAALRKAWQALPWETMETLIQAQRGHGEACLAQAELALAISVPWGFRDTRPMARYEQHVQAARAALKRFLSIPDWPWRIDLAEAPIPNAPKAPPAAPEVGLQGRQAERGDPKPMRSEEAEGRVSFSPPSNQLGPLLRRQAPQLQDLLRQMAEGAVAALSSDPTNPRLQANLAFLLRILNTEGADWLMGEMALVTPLPGQEWPPLPLIHAQADVLRSRKRWSELLTQAQAWQKEVQPLFLNSAAWDQHLFRKGTLLAYMAMARSWGEGWDILPETLRELRSQSGGHYPPLAQLTLRGASLPGPPSQQRDDLFRLAELPSLPTPAMPASLPAWRIEVRDSKDFATLKEAFDRTPSLIQWLPSERLLTHKPALNHAWLLSLGEDIKGMGDHLHLPDVLSDTLSAGRPGRLWVASDRVGREPGALGPRRFRIAYLLQRMPCRALESDLASDLSQALLGADLPTENLDEGLWFTEARRAIPALEAHLRCWPMDAERWKALAFWTAFVPSHGGPVELAAELPSFQPGLPFQLCLPVSTHNQIGNQLTKRRAWAALRAWFEPLWRALPALQSKGIGGQKWMRRMAAPAQTFLDTAYANLGLPGERKRLQEEGRGLDGWASEAKP